MMLAGGVTSWKDVHDAVDSGCGFYSSILSYVDSGWEVKIENSSSEVCEIYPAEEQYDMDSLASVLVRLNSAYPDIHKAYIHVRVEEYICSIDDKFQIYTPDPVSSLAMRIMQSCLIQSIATKRWKAHNSKEDD